MAAGQGAVVLATGPDFLAEHLRGLGADRVIDFAAAPTVDQVRVSHPGGIDAVLDLVTAPGAPNQFADLLRLGGVLVSTNGAADPEGLATRGRTGVNLYNSATRADLQVVAGLASDGRIRVRIDAEVGLADAPNTVASARTGAATGKTVIVLGESS